MADTQRCNECKKETKQSQSDYLGFLALVNEQAVCESRQMSDEVACLRVKKKSKPSAKAGVFLYIAEPPKGRWSPKGDRRLAGDK